MKIPALISFICMVYVHAGRFHADDVMALALLLEVSPYLMWKRIPQSLDHMVPGSIMVDIGLGDFDHHQEGSKVHYDGTPYSAAGLIWEKVAEYLFPDQQSRSSFYRSYIKPIELQDNGCLGASGKPCKNPLSAMISSFVPTWDSNESKDEAFEKALHICRRLIRNEVNNCKSLMKAKKLAENLRADKDGFIYIDKFMPIQNTLAGKARVLCYPSDRTEGRIAMVPVPSLFGGRFQKRFFPKEWLKNPPEGMTFVHKGLFTSEWTNLELAKKAMAIAKLSDRC